MFEARLTQGNILKMVIEALGELVDETNVNVNDAGVNLQSLDSSHVALVHLKLNAGSFDEFRLDRKLCLGIKLSLLNQVLKCASKDDVITLKTKDDEPDDITLLFENPNVTRISNFQLKLMDIDAEAIEIPPLTYDAVIQLTSASFRRICNELSTISDTVEVICNKEGVQFKATGQSSSGAITLKQSDSVDDDDENDDNVQIAATDEVHLSFALRYLKQFSKAAPLSKYVTIRLCLQHPVQIEYKIGEKGDVGSLVYYLAPKIGEDEDEDDEGAME